MRYEDNLRIEFKEEVWVKSVEGGLILTDGTVISDFHEQDCCENVFANWDSLEDSKTLFEEGFTSIKISKVLDSGFNLLVGDGFWGDLRYFVPCYNYQNGFYSSDLALTIKGGTGTIVFDISDSVEYHID